MELPQSSRLELRDARAGHAELGADLLEGLRLLAREAETKREHVAHPLVQAAERIGELRAAQELGEHGVGLLAVHVLDHVAVHRVSVADRRLEADGVLDELEQLLDALELEPALLRKLFGSGISVELLREHA